MSRNGLGWRLARMGRASAVSNVMGWHVIRNAIKLIEMEVNWKTEGVYSCRRKGGVVEGYLTDESIKNFVLCETEKCLRSGLRWS